MNKMTKVEGLPHGAVSNHEGLENYMQKNTQVLPEGIHYVGYRQGSPFWYQVRDDQWVSIVSSSGIGNSSDVLLFDNYFFALGYYEYLRQGTKNDLHHQ